MATTTVDIHPIVRTAVVRLAARTDIITATPTGAVRTATPFMTTTMATTTDTVAALIVAI
jgi:hypothetical protein